MQSPKERLDTFKNSRFLTTDRSNGYIKPGSMRIVDFESALETLGVYVSTYDQSLRIWGGVYILNPDGSFNNIHRALRSMHKAGLLEVVKSKKESSWSHLECLQVKVSQ